MTQQQFNEVDLHVNDTIKKATKKGAGFKDVWKSAMPVLLLLSEMPLIPKKWKVVIAALIAAGNEVADPSI